MKTRNTFLSALYGFLMILLACSVVAGILVGMFYWFVWPWLSVVLDINGVPSTGNYQFWGT